MNCLFLNGKFTSQRLSGVQRVATCLVQALDAQLLPGSPSWVLLCPAGGRPPPLKSIEVRHVGIQGLPLHLWEQIVLPIAASRGLLVNLAGAAPWLAGPQACMIHDAAVFDVPHAYTRPFRVWYRLLFRHLARRAVRLLTVSRFSRRQLALHLRLRPELIAVIGNGSDHLDTVVPDAGVLARHGLVGRRFLLAVGSANPTKNIAALLAAHAGVAAAADHRLVVVGGRNGRVFAHAPADMQGVIRIADLDDAGLKALYQHAAGLVFPSTYEGFGLPPLEAMACGCPVAASSAASLPEVCGEAAIYFDPASTEQMAGAMVRLLDDRMTGKRLRADGLQHASMQRWVDAARRLRQQLEPLVGAFPSE